MVRAVQVDIHIQLDPSLKGLGFNSLKPHPFQASGFKYQPAPLRHGRPDPRAQWHRHLFPRSRAEEVQVEHITSARPRVLKARLVLQLLQSTSLPSRWLQHINVRPLHRGEHSLRHGRAPQLALIGRQGLTTIP